jgi:hypothetical protein
MNAKEAPTARTAIGSALITGIGLLSVGRDFLRHIGLGMMMADPMAMIVRGLVKVRRSLETILMRMDGGCHLLAVGWALAMPVHARKRAAVEHERRHGHEHQARDEAPKVGPQGVQRFAPDIS